MNTIQLESQLILSAVKDEWVRFAYADYLMEQNGGEGIELSDPLWVMGDKGYSDGHSDGYGYGYGDGYGYGYG